MDKSFIIVVDQFSDRVLEYDNVTLFDYGFSDTVTFVDNYYDTSTGAFSGYGNYDSFFNVETDYLGGFYKVTPDTDINNAIDYDLISSTSSIDIFGYIAYEDLYHRFTRSDQSDESVVNHGDWVVEAICQNLNEISQTSLLCIDVDTLNGQQSHLDNLFDIKDYQFDSQTYWGSNLEVIIANYLIENDSRFGADTDDTFTPVAMSISIAGAPPSAEELAAFELFELWGVPIIQAAPNVGQGYYDWGTVYSDVVNVGAWNQDENGNLLLSSLNTLNTLDILADGSISKEDWGSNFGTSFATPKVAAGVANLINEWIVDLNVSGTSVADLEDDSSYTSNQYSSLIEQVVEIISTSVNVKFTDYPEAYVLPILTSTIEQTGLYPYEFPGVSGLTGVRVETASISVPDTVSPVLTAFDMPAEVDISLGEGELIISASAWDASGVYEVVVYFDGDMERAYSSGGTPSTYSLLGLRGFSDSWSDGSSVEDWFLTDNNALGTYTIDYVKVEDTAGNIRTYTEAELSNLGFNTSFELVNGTPQDTVSDADTTTDTSSVIIGTDEAEAISGTVGADVVQALDGNDYIMTLTGDDEVHAGGGDDTIWADAGNDVIYGGAGDDTIYPGEGDDTSYGGEGDDTLYLSSGNDLEDGGAGNDTIKILPTHSGIATTIDLLIGQYYFTVQGSSSFFNLKSIENVDSQANADLTIKDTPDVNIITTGRGDDVILSVGGDDVISTGGGNDRVELATGFEYEVDLGSGDDEVILGLSYSMLDGGTGSDTANFLVAKSSVDGFVYDTETNIATVTIGNQITTFKDFEYFKFLDDTSAIATTDVVNIFNSASLIGTIGAISAINTGSGSEIVLDFYADASIVGTTVTSFDAVVTFDTAEATYVSATIHADLGFPNQNDGVINISGISIAGVSSADPLFTVALTDQNSSDDLAVYVTDVLVNNAELDGSTLLISSGPITETIGAISATNTGSGTNVSLDFYVDPALIPEDVSSFDMVVRFDSNGAEYVSADLGDFLGFPNASGDTITLSGISLSGVSSSDPLFTLNFTDLDASEDFVVYVSDVLVNGSSLEGSTLLIGEPDTFDVSTTVATRDGSKMSDVAIAYNDGNDTTSILSGNDGVSLASITSGADVTVSGSLDYDTSTKSINSQDALDALRLSVGINTQNGTSTAFDYIAADFNQDGRVTSQDALAILKYAVGLSTTEQAEWVFVDSDGVYSDISRTNTNYDESITITDLSSATNLSLTGILIGDVNDSYSGLVA